MICQLCKSKGVIRNNHIIPQFISDWIKKTSALGGLRNTSQPNLRRQDTSKVPLLCSNCEVRISQWEAKFAEEIFYPFNEEGRHQFTYSDWLLRFAISLSWRVGITQLDDLRSRNPVISVYFEKALSAWGAPLQGKAISSHLHAHHLFFDSMAHCIEFVGTYYDDRYALKTIDCCLPSTDTEVAVYAKLPGIVFYSAVHPTSLTGWKGTQIIESGRITDVGQEVTCDLFWRCMQDGTFKVAESMNSMSDKQKQKLRDRIKTEEPGWRKRQRHTRNKNI